MYVTSCLSHLFTYAFSNFFISFHLFLCFIFIVSLYIFYLLCIVLLLFFHFFFFKQKTAYEMLISDWSSDVCSSDLPLTLAEIMLEEGVGMLARVLSDSPYSGMRVELANDPESVRKYPLPIFRPVSLATSIQQ